MIGMNELMLLPLGLFWLVGMGLSIYLLVLFIKVANRLIKALDIYISKNQNK